MYHIRPCHAIGEIAEDQMEGAEQEGLKGEVCSAPDKSVKCWREAVLRIVMGAAVSGLDFVCNPRRQENEDQNPIPWPQRCNDRPHEASDGVLCRLYHKRA